jgi:eukaryotic-like serine/threonine-protein kinase
MAVPRFGLATRIFLASAGIVTVVLAVTLYLTSRSAQQAAQTSIARGLASAQERVVELVSSERAQLAARLRAFADSPEQRANIETVRDSGDLLDYAQTAAEQVDAQWVQLISREGVRLAKSDDPSAPTDTMLGSPLVRAALDGQMSQAFGVAGDTALTHVVAVPILGAGERLLGALLAAKYVSDSIVRAVGSTTQSEVFFYALDRDDQPRISAGTDGLRQVGDPVLVALAVRLRADSSSDPSGVEQAGRPSTDALEPVEFNGEHYVGRGAVLTTASGSPVGGFVAMRSLDRELNLTGYTQLRNTLLFAGGGGLLIALLVAGVTSRQIVRPVTLLANATRRAAEGDYQAEIPEGGRDEIGTLASAFRRLLGDLRDKQALVDFLSVSSPAAARTLTMSTVTPTMKMSMGGATMIEPGSTLANRYEIKGVLGVGGMGVVYKAHDRELGETVAIKTLKPDMVASDTTALERFKSEIRLARRISHRNVVRTHDLGESGGLYYITMEYVEGKSLKELVKERGRLPAAAVLTIAKQLCRALEVAHDEGVIHRDIKPQNMVVHADGVLKVMDFGIARLASRPAEAGHTQQGMVVGTPEYMAPEQLLGEEVDARADLYATGCVMYECLTGRVPLTADTPMTLIAKVLDEEPAHVSAVQPDVPPALAELVMWALAKNRDQRPRSAADLHARLDQIALI